MGRSGRGQPVGVVSDGWLTEGRKGDVGRGWSGVVVILEVKHRRQTFRKAALTVSVLIMPLRQRFSTSSALDVPELRHAMLVIMCVLVLLVGDEDGDRCLCRLTVGLVAVSRRDKGLFDEKNRATVD